jgi:adenylate cyclase
VTGQHYWDAELHRLRAELALGSDPASARAESSLLEAIDVARRQQARWWELRAATRLSRLWADRGQTARAHALLSDICSWFTEGSDTADLTDARALLERLAGAAS